MRILWYSNVPWAPSGYGQQTALWVPRLQAAGHDTAVAAFYGLQGVPLNWHGISVLPGSSEDQWAQDLMYGHYQQHKADLLITLMDAWVLDPNKLLPQINAGMRVAHWQPVDCEPLGQLDHRILSMCGGRPIAMSRHGEKQLKEFDPLYVPHGVDADVFKPADPEQVGESRDKGGFKDLFLIGINAANQDPVRKGFGEQLLAFRLFADRHPDARLLIHTRKVTRQGADLDRLVDVLKLQPFVEFGDQYLTATGLTTQAEIARWYSICDVFSNCSYGEGFGLPVLEAQACGTPVVVTNCSSLTELCGSGWLVEGEFYYNAGHGSWWTRPSVQAILAAYEQAYEERGTPQAAQRRVAAREFALQYAAEAVLRNYWEPALDELEGVAGTVKYAGLRWEPGDDMIGADQAGEDAVLQLLPEGGVFADACAGAGYGAVRAAMKASRVLAVSADERLKQNVDLNKLANVVVQDRLDVAAEPFLDVVRCDMGDLPAVLNAVEGCSPALVIRGGKGKHGLRASLPGYTVSLIPGSKDVVATPA